MTDAEIADWLGQFSAKDLDLAARVLDSVRYVTHDQMESAFKRLLGRLPGWDPTAARRRGKWRFVAFSRTAGESGDAMLQKFRSAASLGRKRFDELFIGKSDLLSAELGPDDTVVFVDDFAGTGDQVCTYWKEMMRELLPGEPRLFLVLIATRSKAKERIGKETALRVICSVTLQKADDLFSTKCRHFTTSEKLTVLRYCKKANSRDPKGYGECGLTVVLANKTPNNSIPILHSNHARWRGLFPRD